MESTKVLLETEESKEDSSVTVASTLIDSKPDQFECVLQNMADDPKVTTQIQELLSPDGKH